MKAAGSGNSPGATIDSSDHRSIRLFSSGVPVTANFAGARSLRTAWWARACRFFTNCASSRNTADHAWAAYSSASSRSSV